MAVTVRRLTSADAQAYRTIRLEALTDHPQAYGTSPQSFSAQPLDGLERFLEQVAVFGAMDDSGELAGIMAFEVDDGERQAHRGWLVQVYVKPQMRGSGCGDALMAAIVEYARGHVIQLHLMVGAHNAPAIALYRRWGFELYGTDPRCLDVEGRFIDEHMMVRFLDEAPGKTNENE